MMTVEQTAKWLNVSSRFVYRKCASGEIESYRLGSRIRISPKAIERYLERQKTVPAKPVATPDRRKRPRLSILKLRD